MPQGIQCWDANGNLVLDLTDRLSRVLGRVTIPINTSGYITDARFAQGEIWWQVLTANTLIGTYAPNMTADKANNRIAYTPQPTFSAPSSVDVIYGVY